MAQQVVWDEAISFAGIAGTATPGYWVSVAPRVRDQASSSRGKQYEWDQQQAGNYSPTLINQDAALLPGNASSPYSPNVTLRRPYRKRFQYPPTQNMLTIDQATGGSTQTAGVKVDLVVPVWISYVYDWTITAEADAFTGPNVFKQIVAAAQAANSPFGDMDGWTILPGSPHSAQCVMRATAGGTTPQVRLLLLWRDINGATLSTSTGGTVTLSANSRTWQQLTVSGTAPAAAAGCTLQIQMVSSTAVTWEVSGFQVEYAAAPTTWVQPGVWGGVINSWTDRLPQVYSLNGTYATVTPNTVDTFARLSQNFPPPAFYSDVLALKPNFFFPLNDPTGTAVFADLTGNLNPAPVSVSPYGSGTVAAGQGIQSTSTAGTFLGAPGPVVTMTNPDVGGTAAESCSWINLTSAGSAGPPTVGGWTRMIAFRNTGAGSVAGGLWLAGPAHFLGTSFHSLFYVALGAGASPGIVVEIFTSGGGAAFWTPSVGTGADGNWHLLFISLSADGSTVTICYDGAFTSIFTLDTTQMGTSSVDMVGALAYPADGQFYDGYNGDVAHIGQFPLLTNAQQTALYTSWRTAWQGDSSGTRYSRILGYASYQGPTAIDSGATTDMGPATDIDGQTDAFTLLNNVVTTENGNHYLSSSGSVHFEARSRRYNQLTPTWIFGANIAGGEYPFADLGFDFDLDHVANVAQVTQQMSGQVFSASIAASQAKFDTLTLQRTINVVNPQECVDAANYMVNRFDLPQLRVDSITLNPSRYPLLWGVLAAMDISARIRINMRTVGQAVNATPLVQFDGFVEQIAWSLDASTGDHLAVLQVSPADLNLYWVLSALHTTLYAQANSGGNTAVLNPLPDSASNSFSASVCSGLQLTFEPGTANAETLTVQSVSATSPGYASVTVTFTANLAHTHLVNTTVCEKLPTGITDPTTWDAASILGTSTTLAY